MGPRGREILVLTTHGRRTGRDRSVLVQGFRDRLGNLIVVAANSGRPGNPDWFHNLRADPSAVVELRGTPIPVHAEVVPAAEAAALWPDILRHAPTYERCRKYTGRKIPLVRLIAVPLASDKLTGAL